MMYTIYWKPSQSRNLMMDDCKKADTLKAGMLEQVLENLISWHDIPAKNVEYILNYIGMEFGHILVAIESEQYQGCTVYGKLVCTTVA